MSFNQPVGSRTQSKVLGLVDHTETYGPHIIKSYLNRLDSSLSLSLSLSGCGYRSRMGA